VFAVGSNVGIWGCETRSVRDYRPKRSEGAAVGFMVTVQCRSCGVVRDENLGCGMLGYCYELLGCAACREFVLFEEHALAPLEERPPRECPTCAGPLHEVLDDPSVAGEQGLVAVDPSDDSAPTIGTCPKCDGELVGGAFGLWD